MGCPEGQKKKRTSLYISRKKGEHYYIQTQYNNIFYDLFLGKLNKKLARKARENTEQYIVSSSCPPRVSHNTP